VDGHTRGRSKIIDSARIGLTKVKYRTNNGDLNRDNDKGKRIITNANDSDRTSDTDSDKECDHNSRKRKNDRMRWEEEKKKSKRLEEEVKRLKALNAKKQPLQTLTLQQSENEVSALTSDKPWSDLTTVDKVVPEEVHKKVLRTAKVDLLQYVRDEIYPIMKFLNRVKPKTAEQICKRAIRINRVTLHYRFTLDEFMGNAQTNVSQTLGKLRHNSQTLARRNYLSKIIAEKLEM
jgi:hypothetical protein